MDETSVRNALRAMSARMPGADIEALVAPVMQAWNAASALGRTESMISVVSAVWPHGYAAGAGDGHRLVTDGFARAAQQAVAKRGDRLDTESRRVLQAVAGTAMAIRASVPAATDMGPNPRDYLTVTGDHNGTTGAEDAAAAARVGWTHAYGAGVDDAGWDAARRIENTVKRALGADTVAGAHIDGRSGDDWLVHIEVESRRDQNGRSAAAQAFSPLRHVHAVRTSDTVPPTPGEASRQRHGRSR